MAARAALRKVLGIVAAISLLVPMQAASASTLFVGSCVMEITFRFDSAVRGTNTAPNYTVIAGPSLVDYSPNAATQWFGNQPCLMVQDAFEIPRDSWAFGDGTSVMWTCAATIAGGFYQQDWYDSSGAITNNVLGQHTITGTWDAWQFTLQGPNFIGVADLTLHPLENTKFLDCSRDGFTSLTMVGTMEFQDP